MYNELKEVKVKKTPKIVWIVIAVAIAVIIIGMFIGYYNTFVSQNEAIQAQWAQVENQLKRRNDLIPNLVSTVKGYMRHEKEVFLKVAEARSKLAGARTISEKIEAHQTLGSALGRLLAIAEAYPDLKANQQFNKLMDQLEGTENRIVVERMRYNERVRQYNRTIKRFPGRFFASLYGREPATYFEVPEEEMKVPEVEFP